MDGSRVLVDGRSGLLVSWYFWLRVLDEVNRAARYGLPFGLLLLDVELRPGAASRLLDEASGRVRQVIRNTDLGGLLGPGRVAVLLPHQDAASARVAMDRITAELAKSAPADVRRRPRLLGYPGDGAEISNLLTSDSGDRAALAGSL